MKIGPDGSLCRITSSAKDLTNNVKIVKIPDSIPSYKLVVIRPNDECEELSEKSDDEEEIFDDLCEEFPSESAEKQKVIEAKIDKDDKPNEKEKRVVRGRDHFKRYRPRGTYHKRNNFEFNDRRNTFNNISRKCPNLSNRKDIYNYGNRDFNSAINHSVAYNKSIQHSSEDYSPPTWIDSSIMLQNYTCTPFSRSSRGLLGDRPASYPLSLSHIQSNEQSDIHEQSSSYSPVSLNAASTFQSNTSNNQILPYHPMPNFSANKQSDIHEQSSSYSPMCSNAASSFMASDRNLPYNSKPNFSANNHSNNFIHNQNPYSQRTNYKSSKQTDNFVRDRRYRNDSYSNYNNNNQHGSKKHMNNKNQNERKDWNRKPRRGTNVYK